MNTRWKKQKQQINNEALFNKLFLAFFACLRLFRSGGSIDDIFDPVLGPIACMIFPSEE